MWTRSDTESTYECVQSISHLYTKTDLDKLFYCCSAFNDSKVLVIFEVICWAYLEKAANVKHLRCLANTNNKFFNGMFLNVVILYVFLE